MDNLSACPNCGRIPQIERRPFVFNIIQARLSCFCGFAGPWGNSITVAEENWNRLTGLMTKLKEIVEMGGALYVDAVSVDALLSLISTVDLGSALESEAQS